MIFPFLFNFRSKKLPAKSRQFLYQSFGILFLIFSIGIIGTITYFYYSTIFPKTLSKNRIISTIQIIITIWFNSSVFYLYYKSVFTLPGNPPKNLCSESVLDLLRKEYKESVDLKKKPPKLYCSKCDQFKPERTHHDSISNQCILKMDHFCPWINNTVGYYNHKFFVLLLVYLLLGCLYISFLSLKFLIFYNDVDYDDFQVVFLMMFSFCIALSVSLAILVIWSFFLILSNQTTVEYYRNLEKKKKRKIENKPKFVNRYDLGKRKNFEHFFHLKGKPSILFLFSFGSEKGNGIVFKHKDL